MLPLPYSDNFSSYSVGQEARYFSDQNGAFEIVAAGGGRSGNSLRQMAPTAPINWDRCKRALHPLRRPRLEQLHG